MENVNEKEKVKKMICDFIDSLDYVADVSTYCMSIPDGTEGEYLKFRPSTEKTLTIYGIRENKSNGGDN